MDAFYPVQALSRHGVLSVYNSQVKRRGLVVCLLLRPQREEPEGYRNWNELHHELYKASRKVHS